MKILNGIAIAAVAVMLIVAAQPAQAACSGGVMGTKASATEFSGVWNAGTFTPEIYYTDILPYSYVAATPVFGNSPAVDFWALTTGDPAEGLGDDMGTYGTIMPVGATYPLAGPGLYWYEYGGYSVAGELFTGWGANDAIDGCIGNDPTRCSCVVFTDQALGTGMGDEGFAAVAAGVADSGENVFINQPGPSPGGDTNGHIRLEPMGPVAITGSVRELNKDVTLTLAFAYNPLAEYGTDCSCEPTMWMPHYQIVPRFSAPPSDRTRSLWTPTTAVPFGATQLTVPCGSEVDDYDVYVAGAYYWTTGFQTAVVGANSTRVECGATLADPDDQIRLERPGVTPRTRPTQEKQGKARR